jgi:hypothetical protein
MVSLRVGFKLLASLAILVVGVFCYALGSRLAAVACLGLALFVSKDKIQSIINSNNTLSSNSSGSTTTSSTINRNLNSKKYTPEANLAHKRRDIGLELLNSRLAETGNTELLV